MSDIDKRQWRNEEEKDDMKRQVFKKLQKYRIMRGMERALGVKEEDLKKYMEAWESKWPEQ